MRSKYSDYFGITVAGYPGLSSTCFINITFKILALKDMEWILLYNHHTNFPPAEAHPDVIQSSGEATLESYKNDLAYLKKKVTTLPCNFTLI